MTRPAPLIGGFAFLGLGVPLQSLYLKQGQVLICDFSSGFVPPEMTKTRPVIVISRESTHKRRPCTIVPFSTTAPALIEPWHTLFAINPIGPTFMVPGVSAKCDMHYTVSFERLSKPHRKTRNGPEYFAPKLSGDEIKRVQNGVEAYFRLVG